MVKTGNCERESEPATATKLKVLTKNNTKKRKPKSRTTMWTNNVYKQKYVTHYNGNWRSAYLLPKKARNVFTHTPIRCEGTGVKKEAARGCESYEQAAGQTGTCQLPTANCQLPWRQSRRKNCALGLGAACEAKIKICNRNRKMQKIKALSGVL